MSAQAQRGSIRSLVVFFAIAAPILVAATCAHLETPTSRYESYAAAEEAGAMLEGKWIPSFLPRSSRNIVETHNVNTNKQLITFDYAPEDLGALETECEPQGAQRTFSCDAWRVGTRVYLGEKGKGELRAPGS